MDNLINHFSVKTAKEFFFKKFDKFSEDSEDFSDLLKDDRFSDLEKIGKATFDNGDDMLMFTCKSSVLLTERSSKKSQYEIAKQMMKHERMDSAIAIFMMLLEISGFHLYAAIMEIRRRNSQPTNDILTL